MTRADKSETLGSCGFISLGQTGFRVAMRYGTIHLVPMSLGRRRSKAGGRQHCRPVKQQSQGGGLCPPSAQPSPPSIKCAAGARLPRFGSRVAVCGGAINLYRRHLISIVGLRVILSVARSLERSAVWGLRVQAAQRSRVSTKERRR
jgi:hypothetical protein